MKLYELIDTLMHSQEVIVVDFDNGDTCSRNRNARSTAFLLESNKRLRESKVCLIEIDIYNSTMIIHVLKD